MNDLFNGFMAFICIGATVILLLIAGVNIAHSNIEESCERHGSFYIGDTRFECERTSGRCRCISRLTMSKEKNT